MTTDLVPVRQAELVAQPVVPVVVAASGADAAERFLNFFATQIENDNTRAAYLRAAREFLGWCERRELGGLQGSLTLYTTGHCRPKPDRLTSHCATVHLQHF